MLTGHIHTGAVTQDLTVGGVLFLRSVQQPGYLHHAESLRSQRHCAGRRCLHLRWLGEYLPDPIAPSRTVESPLESAGPRRLWEDSHQTSAVIQDRVHLPGRIQLIAGGRYDSLRDHNYSLVETAPCVPNVPSNTPGAAGDPCATTYDASDNPIYNVPNSPTFTDKSVWLPQYAITFNPIANLTLYSNYGEVLSLGPQAPFWTDNGSQFLVSFLHAPGRNRRKVRAGSAHPADYRVLPHARAVLLSIGCESRWMRAATLCFVSQGRETHNGVELNAQGKAANWLRLNASAAAMNATRPTPARPPTTRSR